MSDTSDAAHEDSPLFLGIDVGGTGIKIGLVDDSGKPLRKIRIDTLEEQGPEDALQRIHAACLRLLSGDPEAKNSAAATSWDRVAGIGLGTPGTMDIPNGLILTPPNLPHWRNFPIRDRLAEITGRPVAFTNDANAAAYGEFWVGSGRDHNSMIMLTLGTGVGGGIIVDGKCIEGANSFGSECGHILIDSRDDARLCVWGGGRGQLEAYASASAVAQRVHEALRAGEPSSLHDVPGGIESLTTLDLAHAGDAGDELALRILTETGRYLGVGVVTLVHTIDPGMVVLGGAMNFGGDSSPAGRCFLQAVKDEFQERAFDVVQHTTEIAFATLGSDAGYIGAAGHAKVTIG